MEKPFVPRGVQELLDKNLSYSETLRMFQDQVESLDKEIDYARNFNESTSDMRSQYFDLGKFFEWYKQYGNDEIC